MKGKEQQRERAIARTIDGDEESREASERKERVKQIENG
jgi:hypothetical protein